MLRTTGNKCKEYFIDNNILHHKCAAEDHQANGRIERFHRTVWQALRKENINKEIIPNLEVEMEDLINKYNDTIHRGIEMRPSEAMANPEDSKLKLRNSEHSPYSKEFRIGHREKFEKGESVIMRSEIERQTKLHTIYDREGKICEVLPEDSYLVKMNSDGKIFKRAHWQIKKKNF